MIPPKVVQVHDRVFKETIPLEQILLRVEEMASVMRRDLQGVKPVFLPVLNGAFMFATDLMRRIHFPCEIEFIRASSYVGVESSGTVDVQTYFRHSMKDRHLVILEDIIDSGRTTMEVVRELEAHKPASIAVASMLVRAGREADTVEVKYTGFELDQGFVVGYGLDYNGLGRNLPGLYQEV